MAASIQLSVTVPGASANPALPGTQITMELYQFLGILPGPPPFGNPVPTYSPLQSFGPFNFESGALGGTISNLDPNLQFGLGFTVDNSSRPPSPFFGNWNDTTDCLINLALPDGPITVVDNETIALTLSGELLVHVILSSPKTHSPTISFQPKE